MSILRLRLALTAFVTVVAATAVLAPPADAGKVYPAWVIPEVLKVRSGPGTDRDQIGSLTKGTKVYVTSFSNNWCWAKLPDGRWGWIAEWLLQFSADKGRALAEAGGVSNGSSSSSSSSSDYPPAWIVPETTNVRSGPGTQYEMRGQLSRGTKVYVVTRKSGWSKCRTPGGYGWIRDDLLERNADTGRKLSSGGSSSTSTRKAFVNGDGVRLRSGPGTNHSIRASLTKGQTVFVTGTKDGWASVSVQGGASGWVSADLLKYEGTTSVPSGGASSSSGPSSGSSGGTMKGFVDGSSVHLRSGPSLSESIRAKVVKGQTLYITERRGDWYRATVHGGGEGWIHTSLVKLAGAGDTERTETTKAFVAGGRVHLRATPSTSGRIKATIVEGQTLYVTSRQGDWYQVTVHGGESGWVHSSLVKLPSAGSSTPAPAPAAPAPSTPTPTPGATRTVDDLVAWVAEDLVNVRYGPGTDTGVKMKLGQGTKVQVLELSGHWCKIKDPDGSIGWVAGWVMNFKGPGEAPTVTEGGRQVEVRTAWVARPEVNLRSGPGTSYEEIAEAALGTEVIILDSEGDWYKVALDNGKTGYMASWLLDTRAQRRARQEEGSSSTGGGTSIPVPEPAPSGFGQQIVQTARKYIGSPYVSGGASPSGFDCSGFVHYVLKQNGVSVSRSSRSQFTQGTPVSRDDLQVGDVIFFRNTYRAGISHVGIYVGNNQFIHAANSRTDVKISDMTSSYYTSRYAGARRMR